MCMHTFDHALKCDLESVRRLDVEAYGDNAYSYVTLRQLLDIAGELFRVCKDDEGNAIAYGIIAPSASRGSAWLLSLVVSSSHQRKGIGTALVNHLLNEPNSLSLERVYLTVAPGDDATVSLYERLGFAIEKFEHHYFGHNEDRIIMCRLLGA
jgi:[ribosomal protein S18]-alanine N-acetyltransferase